MILAWMAAACCQAAAADRKLLLEKHGIEIGGGLGELAGKIWRVGLMGYGARPEVLDQALAAFKDILGK